MVEIPKTCKAGVLEEYGKPLQIREVSIPEVDPGSILVKVEMEGIRRLYGSFYTQTEQGS